MIAIIISFTVGFFIGGVAMSVIAASRGNIDEFNQQDKNI